MSPRALSPKAPPKPTAARRRLPAEEARRRILDAAEKQLAEVGPEGLRLTDLAAHLGISHPAILHHFGSREGLIAAVVGHAMDALNDKLVRAMTQPDARRDARGLLDLVSEFYAERGTARVLAWLILSDRLHAPGDGEFEPLRKLAQVVHEQRQQHEQGPVDFGDTLFRCQLTAIALLGDAIFGDSIRRASGSEADDAASRAFRGRLAEFLSEPRK